MIWRPTIHKRIVQLADGLATAASFVLAFYGWKLFAFITDRNKPFPTSWDDAWKILTFSVIWVIILTRMNAYSYQIFTSLWKEFKTVIKAATIGVFIFFAAYFIFRFQYIPRAYIFIFAVLNPICLAFEKLLLFHIEKLTRKSTRTQKSLLVIGTGERAEAFVQAIKNKRSWGLDIIGFLSKKQEEKGKRLVGEKILGTFSDIVSVLHKNVIDEVIICVPEEDFAAIKKILETCEREGVQVRMNSDFFGHLVKSVTVDYLYDMPIVSLYTFLHDEWALYLKRLIDIVIAATLLLVLSPLILFIVLLIKFTSGGSVFYKWRLLGLNKKPFTSYKFRTMVENAEEIEKKLREKNINEMNGVYFKLKEDFRVTKLGRILRKFSMDELPQLYSVLKGDMSLVGPRPVRILEKDELHDWHRRRFSIRPGVTSLWVIRGKNKITDFDEIAKLDLQYLDNWSLWTDLRIMLKTLPILLLGKNL